MNLSHAVLHSLQLYYQKFKNQDYKDSQETKGIHDPEPFLKLWLNSLNFDLTSQKRWNALTFLKQLVLKATPSEQELHQLEMIVQQTVRRINEKNTSKH